MPFSALRPCPAGRRSTIGPIPRRPDAGAGRAPQMVENWNGQMRRFGKIIMAALLGALLWSGEAYALDPENTLYMDLETGRVVIALRPDLAPKHVARIKELVRQHFYDGLKFHRVIDGFMAQTGDPNGDGTGGSGTKLPAEFSAEKHVRGTV